jgi:hypothetical protein
MEDYRLEGQREGHRFDVFNSLPASAQGYPSAQAYSHMQAPPTQMYAPVYPSAQAYASAQVYPPAPAYAAAQPAYAAAPGGVATLYPTPPLYPASSHRDATALSYDNPYDTRPTSAAPYSNTTETTGNTHGYVPADAQPPIDRKEHSVALHTKLFTEWFAVHPLYLSIVFPDKPTDFPTPMRTPVSSTVSHVQRLAAGEIMARVRLELFRRGAAALNFDNAPHGKPFQLYLGQVNARNEFLTYAKSETVGMEKVVRTKGMFTTLACTEFIASSTMQMRHIGFWIRRNVEVPDASGKHPQWVIYSMGVDLEMCLRGRW